MAPNNDALEQVALKRALVEEGQKAQICCGPEGTDQRPVASRDQRRVEECRTGLALVVPLTAVDP